MKYFIVSQNLLNSDVKFPEGAILRINLAWHKDLDSIAAMLFDYIDYGIFLDIPISRKKPPNHNHDLDKIAKLANSFKNVKYVAISNVEKSEDISHHCQTFKAKIVPKIESNEGIINLENILDTLNYEPSIIMLDHEDLFSNLVSLKKESHYLRLVDALVSTCKKRNVELLRVKGIVFTND